MFEQPTFQVTARLDQDGEPSVRVTAFCAYGNRSASVTQDITDEKVLASVGAALKKALSADVKSGLNQQAIASAAQSYAVATQKGEKL